MGRINPIVAVFLFAILLVRASAQSNTPPADTLSVDPQAVPDVTKTPPAGESPVGQTSPPLVNPSIGGPNKSPRVSAKDDLDSIGNRGVGTSSKLGNMYSLEAEIALGKGISQQVEQNSRLIQDPVVTEYVNRLGQLLVRNSDARVSFVIKVIDSDDINAFAIPGGFLYVNSGLISAAEDEAELAGVMAHEIAHVAARHGTRQMTRNQIVNMASIPLIFVGGGAGFAIRTAMNLAVPLTFLSFGRGFESEADYLGLEYMYKSGYDPQAFVSFFEKIQAAQKAKTTKLSKAFSTHPPTKDRIKKTQDEIAQVLPPRSEYIVDTSDFEAVKLRLAIHGLRIKDRTKEGGPTLHRADEPSASSSTSTDASNGTNDNDRPTLTRKTDP